VSLESLKAVVQCRLGTLVLSVSVNTLYSIAIPGQGAIELLYNALIFDRNSKLEGGMWRATGGMTRGVDLEVAFIQFVQECLEITIYLRDSC
jgi:hypothetical protein